MRNQVERFTRNQQRQGAKAGNREPREVRISVFER